MTATSPQSKFRIHVVAWGLSTMCHLQARELAAVALAPLCLLDGAESALGAASTGVHF